MHSFPWGCALLCQAIIPDTPCSCPHICLCLRSLRPCSCCAVLHTCLHSTKPQYYYETIFPRIPKIVADDIQVELGKKGLPTKGKGNGGCGGPDRRGGDDGNRRPASVKASLSVAFGQRAPNRAGTKAWKDERIKAVAGDADGGSGRGGSSRDRGGGGSSRDRGGGGGSHRDSSREPASRGYGRSRSRSRERPHDRYDSRDRDRGGDRRDYDSRRGDR